MKNWRAKFLASIMFAFVCVVLLFMELYKNSYNYDDYSQVINSGWTLKYNTQVYENADLSSLRFPITNIGDWLVLTGTIPNDIPKNSSMLLHIDYNVTDVYLDGEKIFSHGVEEYKKGELAGYGNVFISLPEDAAGKPIKITMLVTEPNAYSSIQAPTIYQAGNSYKVFLHGLRNELVVSVALIIVGLCIALVTFCLFFKSYSMEKLFCIGVLSVCIGCWSLCSNNLDCVFFNNLKVKTLIEYTTLYLMVLPLLLYFRETVEKRNKKWEIFVYYSTVFVEIQLVLISVICQATERIHMPSFLKINHIMMGIVCVMVLYIVITDIKAEKTHKILLLGFSVAFVTAARDLIAFNYLKYISKSGNEGLYKSYLPIAVLFFIVTMLADFINEARKSFYVNAENEILNRIAYVDVLTGLSTRRKCEEVLDEIDKRGKDFGIVQLDLNMLKETNDDYGHEKGDELINRLASVLRDSFPKDAHIGRMGGDEFIVIVPDLGKLDIEGAVKKFKEGIDENNRLNEDKTPRIILSVSYGYCLSTELENPTTKSVYKEADKRMYNSKIEFYRSSGKDRRRSN